MSSSSDRTSTPSGTSQLGTEINDAETDQIVAFLGALTGKMPEVVYPVLPAETLKTPRPTGEVQ
jgi:cytochrome c peroxidase